MKAVPVPPLSHVEDWCRLIGCSKAEYEEAARIAGDDPLKVRLQIARKRAARQDSRPARRPPSPNDTH